MRFLALAFAILAQPAGAADYCRLDATAQAALPAALAGEWQGGLEQAIALAAGAPSVLPRDEARRPARFAGSAEGLVFSDATTLNPVTLEPVSGADWDFALPGESPLAAAELLDPLLQAAYIPCPLGKLPQFRGSTPMHGTLVVTFHAFVLSDAHMLMVMQVKPDGAPRADGLRAVVDFTR